MKKTLVSLAAVGCAMLTGCGGGGSDAGPEASMPIQLTAQKTPSFGAGGTVRPDVSKLLKPMEQLTSLETAGVTQDELGRIVVVGQYSSTSTNQTAFVARFQADGKPDLSCGGIGVSPLFGLGLGESMGQVAVTPAGKILALRNHASGALVRINEGCEIDASFGQAGAAQLPAGVMDLRAFDLDSAGAIVGVAESSVMRFTAAGQLDATYGSQGVTKLAYPADASISVDGVVVRPDGSSVLSAMVRNGAGAVQNHFAAMVRITSAGSVDASYGQAGWAASIGRFETRGDYQRTSIAGLPDGSTVLVWGGLLDGRGQVAMAMKADATGQLAGAFGDRGIAQWTVPGGEHSVHKRVVADGSNLAVCGDINPSGVPDRQAAYAMKLDALKGSASSVVGISNPDVSTYGSGDSGFYKVCRGLSSRNGRTVMSVGVAATNTKPVIALINF